MKWLKKKLGLDKQEEQIEKLIDLSNQFIKKNKNLESKYQNSSKRLDQYILNHSERNKDQDQKLQDIKKNLSSISEELSPSKKSFNPNFELVDPLNTKVKLFSFERVTDVSVIKKTKIDTKSKSFLRVLASSMPELVSNTMLTSSYRFVFPQGMSGEVMKMASGQGTAIMQGGKIIKHGSYMTNMAVAAPLMVASIGNMLIRQHYLAKINANLEEINQIVSQLLELEFIKKQSKIESIIYFLDKAHNDFPIIENNKEYRNAFLTNLVRTNTEIFELIQFYKKSLKFIDNENSAENELNLKYYIVLHQLFYQGKSLEFKYANEYNGLLITNLRETFDELISQSNEFLGENRTIIEEEISNIKFSDLDWLQNKKRKKENLFSNLSKAKSIVDQIINNQNREAEKITLELMEFHKNITKKQEYLIEKGELYEVLD